MRKSGPDFGVDFWVRGDFGGWKDPGSEVRSVLVKRSNGRPSRSRMEPNPLKKGRLPKAKDQGRGTGPETRGERPPAGLSSFGKRSAALTEAADMALHAPFLVGHVRAPTIRTRPQKGLLGLIVH